MLQVAGGVLWCHSEFKMLSYITRAAYGMGKCHVTGMNIVTYKKQQVNHNKKSYQAIITVNIWRSNYE
jgi:hypothetical protein